MPHSDYQLQGQYSTQGFQPPLGQSLQGTRNFPVNYQPYVQPGYGPQYVQPSMGQYPGINQVWDQSKIQQTLQQPNVQSFNQLRLSIGFVSTQQSVQPTIPISAPGSVQQPGPSTPRTLPQTVAAATYIQPSIPIYGVSVAPISAIPQISIQIPQVSIP